MLGNCSLRVAAFGALGILLLGPVAAHAQSAASSTHKPTMTATAKKERPSDVKAIEIMKAVSDRLAAIQTLSFVAVDTFETQGPQGAPLVHAQRSEVTLQRPDKLRVMVSGNGARSQFYCNRNTTMTYSPGENALVIEKAPPTLSLCLRDAYKASAIYFPFLDLIAADRYSDLAHGIAHASYIGQSQAVGGTNTDVIAYSGDNVSVQMWVGAEDRLPRLIRAVSLDDPNRVRHNVGLSNWQIEVPVSSDVFTSLKPDGPRGSDSTEAHAVGTSGMQRARQGRPLWIHTFSAKYWGASAPVVAVSPYNNYYGGTAQTTPSGAGTYYQSPDGWGYYPPSYYGYYPPAPAPYPGAQCLDCDAWPTEGGVDTTPGSFDISLGTGWYDAGVAAGYNRPVVTYPPGEIVTTLPVGCAAPYTRGAAFYLCGDTWFSAVYGPDGALYYRAITIP